MVQQAVGQIAGQQQNDVQPSACLGGQRGRPHDPLLDAAERSQQHVDQVEGGSHSVAVHGDTRTAGHAVVAPVDNHAVHERTGAAISIVVAGDNQVLQTGELATGGRITRDHHSAEVLELHLGDQAGVELAVVGDHAAVQAVAGLAFAVAHVIHRDIAHRTLPPKPGKVLEREVTGPILDRVGIRAGIGQVAASAGAFALLWADPGDKVFVDDTDVGGLPTQPIQERIGSLHGEGYQVCV